MSYKNIAITFGIIVLLMLLFIDIAPPYSYSSGAVTSTRFKIEVYFEKNGFLPQSLADLPPREGYDNSLEDYWGREIVYEYD